MRSFLLYLLVLCGAVFAQNAGTTQRAVATRDVHHFGIDGDHFALDGKPFQIISGEMHYERIPREYWGDRL
ncbi:MAG TPA: beta-galactosidase, partial [Candidatus Sulfotelmatobacter sp.]|nr:beta-galactosidase [Candidatus Sulfotelmatobacter sp.]